MKANKGFTLVELLLGLLGVAGMVAIIHFATRFFIGGNHD
jgi:hypothetical protein